MNGDNNFNCVCVFLFLHRQTAAIASILDEPYPTVLEWTRLDAAMLLAMKCCDDMDEKQRSEEGLYNEL